MSYCPWDRAGAVPLGIAVIAEALGRERRVAGCAVWQGAL